ncbi:hypothetical protein DFJ73DRAFT_809596 [Zopfochytrium polystomum]|nr:hypothetical protein DFJ73DRAFT_809596 [Zopfochytrium polystomum]
MGCCVSKDQQEIDYHEELPQRYSAPSFSQSSSTEFLSSNISSGSSRTDSGLVLTQENVTALFSRSRTGRDEHLFIQSDRAVPKHLVGERVQSLLYAPNGDIRPLSPASLLRSISPNGGSSPNGTSTFSQKQFPASSPGVPSSFELHPDQRNCIQPQTQPHNLHATNSLSYRVPETSQPAELHQFQMTVNAGVATSSRSLSSHSRNTPSPSRGIANPRLPVLDDNVVIFKKRQPPAPDKVAPKSVLKKPTRQQSSDDQWQKSDSSAVDVTENPVANSAVGVENKSGFHAEVPSDEIAPQGADALQSETESVHSAVARIGAAPSNYTDAIEAVEASPSASSQSSIVRVEVDQKSNAEDRAIEDGVVAFQDDYDEDLDGDDRSGYDALFDFADYEDLGEVAPVDPEQPRCALCEAPIEGRAVHLLGRLWHKEHSMCKECSRPIGVDNFAEIDGFLYCEDHYFEHRGEYIIRKTNPKKKRSSKLETELQQIKQHSNVRRVRNLLNFERTIRLNIITLEDSTDEGSSSNIASHSLDRPTSARRPRRFVTSAIARSPSSSVSSSPNSAASSPLMDSALKRQLSGLGKVSSGNVNYVMPLGGSGRHASVVGARSSVKAVV